MLEGSSDPGAAGALAILESLATGVIRLTGGVVDYGNAAASLLLRAPVKTGLPLQWDARWKWGDGGDLPASALPTHWTRAIWDRYEFWLIDSTAGGEALAVRVSRQNDGFLLELTPTTAIPGSPSGGWPDNGRGSSAGQEPPGALEGSEASYRNLVENLPIGLTINRLDPERRTGHFVYCNPVAERLLGVRSGDPRDEILSRIHPDDLPAFVAEDSRTDATGESFELRFRVRDGDDGWRWLDTRGVLLNEPGGVPTWLGFVDDVTDEVHSQDALRASEARYRNLADALPLGLTISAVQEDGSAALVLYANAVAERLLGVSEGSSNEEFIARIHPEDLPTFAAEDARTSASGDTFEATLRVLGSDDQWRWIGFRTVRTECPTGARLWQGFEIDVTERVDAQRELAESEARHRRLLDSLPIGIFTVPSLGESASFANTPLREIYGGERLASWRDVIDPEDLAELQPELERANQTLAPITARFRVVRPDGVRVWHEAHAEAVHDSKGGFVAWNGYIIDISGRVAAEERRIRAAEERAIEEHQRRTQRMEAVGRLAGGVAHDFNNLLTAITGFAELLVSEIPEADPRHEYAASVLSAAEQATFVTRRLLAFSRRDIVKTVELDANEVVTNLDRIMRRIIGDDISLVIDPGTGRLPIRADRGQIEQVLINLLVNARDAMPEGGTIRVTTRRASLPPTFGEEEGTHEDWLHLAVADEGLGMDEPTRARAFEPYFTTKGQGGTGLGLAIVYGAVQQARGHIAVDSTPGDGTTVHIYIPLLPRASAAADEPPAHVTPAGGLRPLRLLVVEDEEGVRRYAAEVARRLGYEVTVAAGAEEALRLADETGAQFDGLLTDVVMPGMSGRALAEALLRRRPGLAIVYMSGYTDDAIVRHGVQQDEVVFLLKPFRAGPLESKLREAFQRVQRPG